MAHLVNSDSNFILGLRQDAKQLLKDFRNENPDAVLRVVESGICKNFKFKFSVFIREAKLKHIHWVLAREQGFDSWEEMVGYFNHPFAKFAHLVPPSGSGVPELQLVPGRNILLVSGQMGCGKTQFVLSTLEKSEFRKCVICNDEESYKTRRSHDEYYGLFLRRLDSLPNGSLVVLDEFQHADKYFDNSFLDDVLPCYTNLFWIIINQATIYHRIPNELKSSVAGHIASRAGNSFSFELTLPTS